MSSEDNKTISFEKPKKPNNKKSIGWIFGVVVLILISITFVLPSTLLVNNDIVFGSIQGKDVSITDQYLQTQASILSAQYGLDASSFSNQYSIWNQAFLSTISNIALSEMANQAGVKVTDNYVDRAILNSGFYSNGESLFDPDIYNEASNYQRDTFRSYIEESLPANFVMADITRTHSSNGELSLIQDIASRGRSFDYVVLDSSTLPLSSIIEYSYSNPQPFMKVSLYTVLSSTEEEAYALLDEINNGLITIEEAAEESASAADGERNNVFFSTLESELYTAEEANSIFSSSSGEIAGPFRTAGGYTLYKITEEPSMSDFSTDEEISAARSYISSNEYSMITSYIDETAALFEARVDSGDDFFTIAEDLGLDVVTVDSTTANPSEYALFTTFHSTDPDESLHDAAMNSTSYMSALYTSEEGSVLPSEALSTGARIITRVGEDSVDTASSTYISTIYEYLKQDMAMKDLEEAIFRDPTFEDNFISVFFSQMLSF